MPIAIDEEFLSQTLVDLVRIDSRNPSIVPNAPGEALIGEYIAGLLRELGMDVTVDEIAPNRLNVIGVINGTGDGRSLILNGHMDTVGVEGMEDPFSGAIRKGKMYGRGTQDMKGSLAAMIAALKALIDAKVSLAGDVMITAVADEEYMSIGTAELVKRYKADAAIVTEPTDLAICRAHRGYIWYEVETYGRAAHGSRYDEGIDANMRMGRFLAELDKLEMALRKRPAHKLTGPPSLHAAMIKGGTDMSTYAARCLLQVERRYIPGESEPEATQELQNIIDKLAKADATFKATVKPTVDRPPFEIEDSAEIVRILDSVVATHFGKTPMHIGAPFWTDAAFLTAAGIETVLIGPVGYGFHSVEEWVDMASLYDLAYILAQTCVRFCGSS